MITGTQVLNEGYDGYMNPLQQMRRPALEKIIKDNPDTFGPYDTRLAKTDIIKMFDAAMAQGFKLPSRATPNPLGAELAAANARADALEKRLEKLEHPAPSMKELRAEAKEKGINTYGMSREKVMAALDG